METRSWTTISKTEKDTWGPGQWHFEPDKMQWEDKNTGMPCLAVRSHLGNWCGYVGVTVDHPLHGVGYNECARRPQCEPQRDEAGNEWWDCEHRPDCLLEVHGGITYSNFCNREDNPARGICHVPTPGEPTDIWWIGFDCGHYDDAQPGIQATLRALGVGMALFMGASYKSLVYLQAECATLCDQLDDRDFHEKHGLSGDFS